MNYKLSDVTIVTLNFLQQRLTMGAIKNIRKFYPENPLIVVNNGKPEDMDIFMKNYNPTRMDITLDKGMEKIYAGQKEFNYSIIDLEENMGHGSALDYALDACQTPLMLSMDNDIRIVDGALLPEYLEKMEDDVFAVGPTYHSQYGNWVGLWYSLWRKAPIKKYHLTFSNIVIDPPDYLAKLLPYNAYHLEPGALIHHDLTSPYPHRINKVKWRSVLYPLIVNMHDRLLHIKSRKDGDPRELLERIDG